MNRATIAVAAISKLLKREALPAVVMVRPAIKRMGAAISKTSFRSHKEAPSWLGAPSLAVLLKKAH
jgi:hypothetical protein